MAKKSDNTQGSEDTFDKLFKLLKEDSSEYRLLSDNNLISHVPYTCSTGSMVVDSLTMGGDDPSDQWTDGTLVPFGRVVTVTGYPKLGKTTLAAAVFRSMHQLGTRINGHVPITAAIDTEAAINTPWWRRNQVDPDKVIIRQLKTRENTVANVARSVRNIIEKRNQVDPLSPLLILWDSLGMTSSEAQLANLYDKEVGDASDGSYGQAKEIGEYLKPLKDLIAEAGACLYIINHLHTDMQGNVVASGGKKLQHVETYHYRLKRPAQKHKLTRMVSGEEKEYGQQVIVSTVFNKMHPPNTNGKRMTILYDEGISDHYTVYETLEAKSWVSTSGETISFRNYDEFRSKVVSAAGYVQLYNRIRAEEFRLPAVDEAPVIRFLKAEGS